MIRWLTIALARHRYRAIAGELAAVERQLVQHEAYRRYLLDEERKRKIELLIVEGGEIAPALREALTREAPSRQAFEPRRVAR